MSELLRVVAGVSIYNGRVLLLRNLRCKSWIFPGGKFEASRDKDELDCLKRELEEELGLKCVPRTRIGVFEDKGLPKSGCVALACWLVDIDPYNIRLNGESGACSWILPSEINSYSITAPTRRCLEFLLRRGQWS